ncbi:MAG: hypothetical protein AB1724_12645 [Thermodesulfobacteriota bacterium]
MKHLKYGACLLLFQFLAVWPLYAEINSWIDESGIRRYSDTAPDNPEGSVEVLEGVENKEPPKAVQPGNDGLESTIDQIKAEEEAAKEGDITKKQKAEREEKVKSAYDALVKLKNSVTGKIDWREYERLLADAKQKVDELDGIQEIKDVRTRLIEAYESYEVVIELKSFETAGQKASLNNRIRKMNEDWGTAAPENYFKAREICWQRAADRLNRSGISP